jgi:hypothetical protein
VSVLDGFHTTWSNAKATFGEGTPQTGEQYDGSAKLSQARSTLDSAVLQLVPRDPSARHHFERHEGAEHHHVDGQIMFDLPA